MYSRTDCGSRHTVVFVVIITIIVVPPLVASLEGLFRYTLQYYYYVGTRTRTHAHTHTSCVRVGTHRSSRCGDKDQFCSDFVLYTRALVFLYIHPRPPVRRSVSVCFREYWATRLRNTVRSVIIF